MATIALGSDSAFSGLRAFVEQVDPGMQSTLSGPALTPRLAKAVGAQSLEGLDWNSPRFVLLFDDGTAKGLALVGKFKNPAALTANLGQATSMPKGDWAVVGEPAVVAKVGAYALDEFPREAAVSVPTISVYVPHVLSRYRNEIEAAHKQMVEGLKAVPKAPQMGPLFDGYFTGVLSMLEDSQLALVTFDADKRLGGIDIALVPRANTRLATFVSRQKPADFGLLQKLAASQWMVFGGGHFDSGPYRQGLMEMVAAMYSQAEGHAMMALLNAAMTASTGDFAFGGQFSLARGMEISQVFPLTDANALPAAIDKFNAWLGNGKTLTQMNIKTTLVPAATESVNGTPVRGYDMTYDATAVVQERQMSAQMAQMMMPNKSGARLAMVDKLAVVAMSVDPKPTISNAIAAATGKTAGFTPIGATATLLGTARSHKDSLAIVADIGAVMGKSSMPFMMSLGFVGAHAHIRTTVPSEVVKLAVRN